MVHPSLYMCNNRFPEGAKIYYEIHTTDIDIPHFMQYIGHRQTLVVDLILNASGKLGIKINMTATCFAS